MQARCTIRTVGKIQTAVVQRQVVNRKLWCWRGDRIIGLVQAPHDIVDVVMALTQAGQLQLGSVHRERFDHWHTLQQGPRLRIHI